jgi:hypothetical protein
MRVLIDEDTAVQLLGPLAHVLPRHQVDHITRIKWAGKKDRSVLTDAKGAGYDVIITKDRNQLSDPASVTRSRGQAFTMSATGSGRKAHTGSVLH